MDAISIASDVLGALSLALAFLAAYACRVHWIAQAVLPRVPGAAVPPPATPAVAPLPLERPSPCRSLASAVHAVRLWSLWSRLSFSIVLGVLTSVSAAAMAGLGVSVTHVGPITRNLAGLATSWVFGVAPTLMAVHVVAARWRYIASTTQVRLSFAVGGG